jgi:hypothetical protein
MVDGGREGGAPPLPLAGEGSVVGAHRGSLARSTAHPDPPRKGGGSEGAFGVARRSDDG